MKISQILVDMDGVLCDFIGHTCKLMGLDPVKAIDLWPAGAWDFSEGLGLNDAQVWEAIDKRGEDFWAGIPALPWFTSLMKLCESRCDLVVILTSPSIAHSSASGKVQWLQKHIGRHYRNYLIGPKKEVCARPGAVLIDDNDGNCEKFKAHGGEAIVFPAPWNSKRGWFYTAHLSPHDIDPASVFVQHISNELDLLEAK